jgi:hypothetical protein
MLYKNEPPHTQVPAKRIVSVNTTEYVLYEEFHFTTPSTSGVDYHQGNTPKVLGIGAIPGRYNVVLYHETLLKRNVAF